jgi:hypothetical protein
MSSERLSFNSLEDFLVSTPLHLDGQLDDGWGAPFLAKGREIDGTVLFSDITAFSERTQDMSPAETLIFVNNFFTWISAEAIKGSHGVVDKYIGDEIMIVFSVDFGSEDPFVEAVQVARWMAQNDALGFCPHIGIASGRLIVGYVGTPSKYDCSVFGIPVARAARCAAVKPEGEGPYGATIVFPADEWADREVREVIPPQVYHDTDGKTAERPYDWELRDPRDVKVKHSKLQVCELIRTGIWFPGPGASAEERAREGLAVLRNAELYRPDLPL